MSKTITLPTLQGVPDYTFRTRFDGKDYNLRMLWNERAAHWTLDINDVDGTSLVAGIAIMANWPLLRYYHANPAVPPGELIAHDLANPNGEPPGLFDMGQGFRVELTYHSTTDF